MAAINISNKQEEILKESPPPKVKSLLEILRTPDLKLSQASGNIFLISLIGLN